jgi:hypothetical protein
MLHGITKKELRGNTDIMILIVPGCFRRGNYHFSEIAPGYPGESGTGRTGRKAGPRCASKRSQYENSVSG